jgi:hypothetical protein
MAVPTAYLMSTKNAVNIFASLQKAGVPEVFTYDFLKQLGYASSGDRPIIPVMKAIGFLDDSGRPTELYRKYKDPTLAKSVMAQGLRAGYADLFAIDTEAYTKTTQQLTGMFGRLSDKGEAVTQKMASTFKALAALADFSSSAVAAEAPRPDEAAVAPVRTQNSPDPVEAQLSPGSKQAGSVFSLRHDIHVHLPLSTDVAVYDAIFRSLKANLM